MKRTRAVKAISRVAEAISRTQAVWTFPFRSEDASRKGRRKSDSWRLSLIPAWSHLYALVGPSIALHMVIALGPANASAKDGPLHMQ